MNKTLSAILYISSFAITAYYSTAIMAKDHDHDHAHHQRAHVHGVIEMTLALVGKDLEIELDSPAINLVGFEHEAHSEKDKNRLERADAILKSADKVFNFKGASCNLVKLTTDVSDLREHEHDSDHKKHEHEKHEYHQKAELHDEEGHHEEEHHHKKEHRKAEHADISAKYRFHCENPARLAAIEMLLFGHFPRIEKLHMMWVIENQQGARTLTPSKTTLYLR